MNCLRGERLCVCGGVVVVVVVLLIRGGLGTDGHTTVLACWDQWALTPPPSSLPFVCHGNISTTLQGSKVTLRPNKEKGVVSPYQSQYTCWGYFTVFDPV